MATKPTSADFTWAENTNYSAGPTTGQATKVNPPGWPTVAEGFVPGEPGTAETMNAPLNRLGRWTGWLAAGSSAGAADAHILETDSSGSVVVQGVQLSPAGSSGMRYRSATDAGNYTPGSVPSFASGADRTRFVGTFTGGNVVLHLPDEADYNGRRLYVVRAQATGASTGVALIVVSSDGTAELGRIAADENGCLVVESDGTTWRVISHSHDGAGAGWVNISY